MHRPSPVPPPCLSFQPMCPPPSCKPAPPPHNFSETPPNLHPSATNPCCSLPYLTPVFLSALPPRQHMTGGDTTPDDTTLCKVLPDGGGECICSFLSACAALCMHMQPSICLFAPAWQGGILGPMESQPRMISCSNEGRDRVYCLRQYDQCVSPRHSQKVCTTNTSTASASQLTGR